jgi:hypothetical protein
MNTLSMLSFAAAAMILFAPTLCFAQADLASPAGPPLAATPDVKVSGPFTHEKLSIYLIHGPSADGPVPLTLNEALAKKLFKVYETGNVNELAFENTGDEAVFLQSGDIVKGGKQDRVLTVSVLVPPKSGRMPIAAYCVEQSRWAARGAESVATFSSSERTMPSKRAKIAMMAQREARAPTAPAQAGSRGRAMNDDDGNRGANRQGEVWASVAETQANLSSKLGGPVAAAASASSLQLSLENEKLTATKAAYLKAMAAANKDDADVVGFAFAVGDRINSADVYPSHALFAKMWDKLIDAAATEAISEGNAAKAHVAPTADAVKVFLSATADARREDSPIDRDTTRVTRQNAASVESESRTKDGRLLHRSHVAF